MIRRIADENVADVKDHGVHLVPGHGFIFKIKANSFVHPVHSFFYPPVQRILPQDPGLSKVCGCAAHKGAPGRAGSPLGIPFY